MRSLMAAVGVTAVCSVAIVSAQGTMAKDKDQMDKGMKHETMTVTGCVTAGSNGHYVLTNAMPSMSGGDMKDMKDMKGDMKPMSYDLMGGGNLKAHVGHKVEVTGTMASDGKMKHEKMEKTDKEKDKDMDKMEMSGMHETLNVKSVKMISSSCQ